MPTEQNNPTFQAVTALLKIGGERRTQKKAKNIITEESSQLKKNDYILRMMARIVMRHPNDAVREALNHIHNYLKNFLTVQTDEELHWLLGVALAALYGLYRRYDENSVWVKDNIKSWTLAAALFIAPYARAGYHTTAETAAGIDYYRSRITGRSAIKRSPKKALILSANAMSDAVCDEENYVNKLIKATEYLDAHTQEVSETLDNVSIAQKVETVLCHLKTHYHNNVFLPNANIDDLVNTLEKLDDETSSLPISMLAAHEDYLISLCNNIPLEKFKASLERLQDSAPAPTIFAHYFADILLHPRTPEFHLTLLNRTYNSIQEKATHVKQTMRSQGLFLSKNAFQRYHQDIHDIFFNSLLSNQQKAKQILQKFYEFYNENKNGYTLLEFHRIIPISVFNSPKLREKLITQPQTTLEMMRY